VLEEVIPELKANGITEEQLKDMMVNNARRWFKGN
jgi:predicted metal-dependent phosphotriesterase family hydrolase